MSRFSKLVGKLRDKGYSKEYATEVAAKAGREKYGAHGMAELSAESRKQNEEKR